MFAFTASAQIEAPACNGKEKTEMVCAKTGKKCDETCANKKTSTCCEGKKEGKAKACSSKDGDKKSCAKSCSKEGDKKASCSKEGEKKSCCSKGKEEKSSCGSKTKEGKKTGTKTVGLSK
tara:strand:+ start:1425 stop:1784 length:360 start_codon:yes stop_codon:yes gene_type:complete